jgi:serine/threonine protein kinase
MILPSGAILQGGRYQIERELGHGGFGFTYLATQKGLNRKVAIKEFFMRDYCERDANTSQVSLGTSGSREMIERFRRKFIKEAQNIAMLNHANIIRIYDVFEEHGTAYYVMEYLDRGSLAEMVKQRGRLTETDALRYIRQIADALSYIHERKMNHLDVKPGNILIDETDHVVLIDFGLSKRYDDEGNQTSTTPVGISHGYAPFEQYRKGGVGTFSPATDIYSLGATLYKLVTGETPPEADVVGEDGLPVPPYAVYNIGNSNPENLLEFVTILQEELLRAGVLPEDYDFEAHKELVPMQPGDVPITYADTTALERDFEFKPSTSLRDGLRQFAQWYKEFYM